MDGLGADHGGEAVLAILVDGDHVLFLAEQLVLLQRGEARLGDDVVLEVEDALDVLQRHVEQRADARRQRLQEPDVGDGRGELDMAHALAADARQRDFDAALLADDALVLHALVLAAQALIVLDRAKNARAEQTVALRLEGAVVDGLRLLDLAERPGQNLLRAGERDPDGIEHLRRRLRIEEIHDLLVHAVLLFGVLENPLHLARAKRPPSLSATGRRIRLGAPRRSRGAPYPVTRLRRAAGQGCRRAWCSPARH